MDQIEGVLRQNGRGQLWDEFNARMSVNIINRVPNGFPFAARQRGFHVCNENVNSCRLPDCPNSITFVPLLWGLLYADAPEYRERTMINVRQWRNRAEELLRRPSVNLEGMAPERVRDDIQNELFQTFLSTARDTVADNSPQIIQDLQRLGQLLLTGRTPNFDMNGPQYRNPEGNIITEAEWNTQFVNWIRTTPIVLQPGPAPGPGPNIPDELAIAPSCGYCERPTIITQFTGGPLYSNGWRCDICGRQGGTGLLPSRRWMCPYFCDNRGYDICLECQPERQSEPQINTQNTDPFGFANQPSPFDFGPALPLQQSGFDFANTTPFEQPSPFDFANTTPSVQPSGFDFANTTPSGPPPPAAPAPAPSVQSSGFDFANTTPEDNFSFGPAAPAAPSNIFGFGEPMNTDENSIYQAIGQTQPPSFMGGKKRKTRKVKRKKKKSKKLKKKKKKKSKKHRKRLRKTKSR